MTMTTQKWSTAARALLAGAAVAMMVGLPAMAAENAASAQSAPVRAIWKPQKIIFNYQSFSTFYSCDSLEEKLEQILRQVGANVVVRVRSADCGRGPVRMPRAEIQLVAPVEATPEALAELKKGETQRELIARIRGNLAEAEAANEQFPAQWVRVNVGRGKRAANLESGDCELVEQVRKRILPQLAVRVVEHDPPCPPNSPSLSRPKLVVDALVEMPKPDDVAGN
jgi:hypothetical protein